MLCSINGHISFVMLNLNLEDGKNTNFHVAMVFLASIFLYSLAFLFGLCPSLCDILYGCYIKGGFWSSWPSLFLILQVPNSIFYFIFLW